MNIILAPLTLANVATHIYTKSNGQRDLRFGIYLVFFTVLFVLTISFYVLQIIFPWAWAIGFVGHLIFGCCTAVIRKRTREELNIQGHIIEDFVASILLYPSVVLQMKMTLDKQSRQSRYSP